MSILVKEIWTAVMLFSGSVMDIRKKSVPVLFLAAAAAGSTVMTLIFVTDRSEMLLGLIPGGALLAVGKLSGCIGSADAVLLLLLGAMYGLRQGGELMMYSLLLSAIVSIFLIISKRAGRKDTLPFIPFMLAGFLLLQLRLYMNGGG